MPLQQGHMSARTIYKNLVQRTPVGGRYLVTIAVPIRVIPEEMPPEPRHIGQPTLIPGDYLRNEGDQKVLTCFTQLSAPRGYTPPEWAHYVQETRDGISWWEATFHAYKNDEDGHPRTLCQGHAPKADLDVYIRYWTWYQKWCEGTQGPTGVVFVDALHDVSNFSASVSHTITNSTVFFTFWVKSSKHLVARRRMFSRAVARVIRVAARQGVRLRANRHT